MTESANVAATTGFESSFGLSHNRSLVWRLAQLARRKPLGAIGAAFIALALLAACIPSVLAPYALDGFDLSNRLAAPSASHPFGTDDQGRDVLSRVIFGARSTMVVSVAAVAMATIVSLALGVVSGFAGGWADAIIQRFVDTWQAFPGLVFVLFAVAIFGPSQQTLIVTIAILLGAGATRVVRGQTISVKSSSFIEAARVVGASEHRILLTHVLPNILPIVLINISLQIGSVMLIEAALSFLGYGVPPPFPSWGRMLSEAQDDAYLRPTLALFPGAVIALTVYSFNMLGDALRDLLDPRMRGAT
jgi:peptide/nickel transport system permease protein